MVHRRFQNIRFQNRLKRMLPLAVAALLLLPGTAGAAGLGRDGAEGFSARLANPGAFFAQVWEALLDVLPMGGGSIDPNGKDQPGTGAAGAAGEGDGGGSIDPNG